MFKSHQKVNGHKIEVDMRDSLAFITKEEAGVTGFIKKVKGSICETLAVALSGISGFFMVMSLFELFLSPSSALFFFLVAVVTAVAAAFFYKAAIKIIDNKPTYSFFSFDLATPDKEELGYENLVDTLGHRAVPFALMSDLYDVLEMETKMGSIVNDAEELYGKYKGTKKGDAVKTKLDEQRASYQQVKYDRNALTEEINQWYRELDEHRISEKLAAVLNAPSSA